MAAALEVSRSRSDGSSNGPIGTTVTSKKCLRRKARKRRGSLCCTVRPVTSDCLTLRRRLGARRRTWLALRKIYRVSFWRKGAFKRGPERKMMSYRLCIEMPPTPAPDGIYSKKLYQNLVRLFQQILVIKRRHRGELKVRVGFFCEPMTFVFCQQIPNR